MVSVLEEVERMTKLADNLLLVSREDAKVVGGSYSPISLDELVREVAGHMKAVADESGIALSIGAIPTTVVEGDADSLRQVFFNLLDNAVKYTRPGGSVTVRGRLDNQEGVVEVADTGIGIPAESLPRIFDRFYRVDKSRSREMGGTGLGLSICKALVETHGGRIEAESVLGEGSTFRVVLPLAHRDESKD
jgi:two-component system phosphate regulon sensor histidine kinase PhoR